MTLRAAVYARFSTELQSERSISDQVVLCRAYADREGLAVERTYDDAALSGGTLQRPGIQRLLADAELRLFDVVVVEALDRLSRDMADLAGIHKRLQFLGIQIRAVHEGQVDTVLVGLRGLMGQMFREDNAHKVRRGLAGRVKQGLSGGGLCYGYQPDPSQKGRRVIVQLEAITIRRIFEEFIAGKSPRSIAEGLNREGVPAPRGDKWNASTINGSAKRGYGILRNPLYSGRLIWNRVRMIVDPATGKRVPRENPPDLWETALVPECRIVSDELFNQVQLIKDTNKERAPGHQQRPKRLLSGLLRCGTCGSGMSVYGSDKSGRVRIRCSAHIESHSCPDPRSFYLDTVEQVVVESLLRNLKDPEVVTAYVQEYIAERKRLAADLLNRRSALERKIAVQQREIDRVIDAVAKGLMDAEDIGDRIKVAKAERQRFKEELAASPSLDNVVVPHPVAIRRFSEQMKELRIALGGDFTRHDPKGAEALRRIVRTVTVYPDETKKGGVHVKVDGHLNALLAEDAPNFLGLADNDQKPLTIRKKKGPSLSVGKVVAEERCRHYSAKTQFVC